jgi:hypothetical protein
MISEWSSEKRLYVDRIRAVLQYHTKEESQGQTIEQIIQADPKLDYRKAQEALDTMLDEGIVDRRVCYKLTMESRSLDFVSSKK